MAVYRPEELGIKPPAGGFQQGGWYQGRQYWAGTLSDPGVIHPASNQIGAGQAVSEEVNRQSAAAQGVSYPQFKSYLDEQRQKQAQISPPSAPTPPPSSVVPTTTPSTETSGSVEGLPAPTFVPEPTLDLPKLYENLYKSSGISDTESKIREQEKILSEKEKALIEAKAKINDNPFLSEATRVGRIAKLESLYNERIANDLKKLEQLRGEIETKKADIETKLNLELKQYDLESDAAKQALDQLNTLLNMGALDNASGVDIANLTRSTGISSSMIRSAIKARQKEPELNTSLQTIDDGVTQWGVLINTDTGEVINKIALAKSKPKTYKPKEKSLSEKAADQEGAVGAIIQAYIKDEDKQAQISPEDLYRKLLALYPMAAEYIETYWNPDAIRKATP